MAAVAMVETTEIRLTRLESDVEHVRSDVIDLKADVRELRTDFGELRKDFGELRSEFGELEPSLHSFASSCARTCADAQSSSALGR
ncbi:MAG TPA: hypothetical protein VFX20_17210 [Steroidobacteraceae bacterium]|nr:hypothetical protein [Steroidobacteraceae bacterium]